MIEKVTAKNFTVLREASFTFAKGINVVIGSNSSGKSHVLKLAYTAARWSQEMARREKAQARPDKATLQKGLSEKLLNVFRPEGIGRLSTRGVGNKRTEVTVSFYEQRKANLEFSFSTKSTTDVILGKVPLEFWLGEVVFLPTKEMLSLFPGFISLYQEYVLPFDETYYDLCLALEKPLPRGRKLDKVAPLLAEIRKILGGPIEVQNGRFYLSQSGGGRFEIPLVAEGFRKLGMVDYLLSNGTLGSQSILFWDEPETNLNPKHMVDLAKMLIALADSGTQVILATHSLFLMRELSLQLGLPDNKSIDRRFFALNRLEDGVAVSVGESAEDVEPITALDVEIEQSQRYMEAAAQAEDL